MYRKALTSVLAVFLLQTLTIYVAIADSLSEFYAGKTITLYIGAEAGGGYDLYARALSRYMTRYIPASPAILPKNMPGASSMVLGNYLARIAPRDGTVVGAVSSSLLFEPLFKGSLSMARFQGPEMTMIGNGASAHWALLAAHSAGISSIDDLKYKELIVGATSRAGDAYLLTHAVKAVLGLDHLKIITGFSGIREVIGAAMRGEISGCVMDLEDLMALQPQWLLSGEIDVIAYLSQRQMVGAPTRAPLVADFAASDEDRKILDVIFASTMLARPLIAPPEIPPARTRSLRDAFLATLKDPDFLTEASKLKITPALTSGERMEDILRSTYTMPSAILARLRAVLAD
jgi:tripartite-type tricarboxylate transporter receptor subunit TctC